MIEQVQRSPGHDVVVRLVCAGAASETETTNENMDLRRGCEGNFSSVKIDALHSQEPIVVGIYVDYYYL